MWKTSWCGSRNSPHRNSSPRWGWTTLGTSAGSTRAARYRNGRSGMPAIVTLFRQPLLHEWRTTGVRFDALITHVVIHEIGHHFGFSDETMHRLEEGEDL